MDFRFTEDQRALAESVRDFLADTHGPEVLRRLDQQGARDPAIWQSLVDMGLTGVLVPEEFGGLGLGLVDAALIAAECGRACVAEPLVDTAYENGDFGRAINSLFPGFWQRAIRGKWRLFWPANAASLCGMQSTPGSQMAMARV
jgi:alkylation response protein AidB-like acyl-CoA dehydrogenase